MCLHVEEADLGPAHVSIDPDGYRLVFAPGLTDAERAMMARRILAGQGQEQPTDASTLAVCICGFPLDVAVTAMLPPEGVPTELVLALRDRSAEPLTVRVVVDDVEAFVIIGAERPRYPDPEYEIKFWDTLQRLVRGRGDVGSVAHPA